MTVNFQTTQLHFLNLIFWPIFKQKPCHKIIPNFVVSFQTTKPLCRKENSKFCCCFLNNNEKNSTFVDFLNFEQ